ncbi:DsbA family protein [Paracoccus sp. 1_MG-2023]|uniref:DsbA family protein n=1 Tax=unclassified Paracoccus (in: a-proteobacteria) TaxID=2688777 RepID=UPI001C098F6D|nr:MULTISPECIES: DsbA family protein [unclassified Paracoccus (in: a-proteobacteria)]MBU2958578.1 DsbA family protein [Paracoccus sp. C2R09]MDO6667571.1 DsbA family protein [Paracoccus sp. 1_MG-2023]
MKRMIAALALGTALAGPALSFDIQSMTDEERAAFGDAVREYLIANPQTLVEAITALEESQAATSAMNDQELIAENSAAIFEDGHSWVGGNPDGDLTMVEFMDYRCGVCRQYNDSVFDAVEDDGNIRLIVKEFPILGEDSERSSRFALSVRDLGGDEAYKKAHDALITLRSSASDDALRQIAEDVGVDADQAIAGMEDDAVTEILRKNYELAQKMGIQGTPSFVIGDQLLRGVPRAGIASTVEQIRETM